MFRFIGLCLGTLVRLLRARRSLLLENLALRQQLAVLKRRHPRPRLDLLDKLFWVAVRRFWSGWQQSLNVVTPETVLRWHRAGFRCTFSLQLSIRRILHFTTGDAPADVGNLLQRPHSFDISSVSRVGVQIAFSTTKILPSAS